MNQSPLQIKGVEVPVEHSAEQTAYFLRVISALSEVDSRRYYTLVMYHSALFEYGLNLPKMSMYLRVS